MPKPKRTQGRPKLSAVKTVRKTATIPEDVFLYLKNLGKRNYSRGIRVAVEFHKENCKNE